MFGQSVTKPSAPNFFSFSASFFVLTVQTNTLNPFWCACSIKLLFMYLRDGLMEKAFISLAKAKQSFSTFSIRTPSLISGRSLENSLSSLKLNDETRKLSFFHPF